MTPDVQSKNLGPLYSREEATIIKTNTIKKLSASLFDLVVVLFLAKSLLFRFGKADYR